MPCTLRRIAAGRSAGREKSEQRPLGIGVGEHDGRVDLLAVLEPHAGHPPAVDADGRHASAEPDLGAVMARGCGEGLA